VAAAFPIRLNVLGYSAVAAGQTGFAVDTDAVFCLYGVNKFVKPAGAGTRIAGGGRTQGHQDSYELSDITGGAGVTFTGGGNFFDVSRTVRIAPDESGKSQARIIGDIEVLTAQGGGVVNVRLKNYGTIAFAGIDASSTGFKDFDSNWIDLPGPATAFVGRLEAEGTNGVEAVLCDVSVLLR
jgi:hypothetical protein